MKWLKKRPSPEYIRHQHRAKSLMELAAISDRLIAVQQKLHPKKMGMPEFIKLQALLTQIRPIEAVLFDELSRTQYVRDEAIAIAESLELTEVAKALRGKDG